MTGGFTPDRRDILAVTAGGVATLLAAKPAAAQTGRPVTAARETSRAAPFDLDWRFHLGDGAGFEAPGLDDSAWRTVDLPHDWSIEDAPTFPGDPGRTKGPFDRRAIGGAATGFTVGGDGWYRKHFQVAAPKGACVEVRFDGIYMNSEVWLNGKRLGGHPNGYTPSVYDLTPYLAPDGQNLMAVHVRNDGKNSRWYSGSGIYRHVWLNVRPETARIAVWGVGVTTARLSEGRAELSVRTELDDVAPDLTLVSQIRDLDDKIVWSSRVPAKPNSLQTAVIRAPRLWSPDSPSLYTLETELRRGGVVLDHLVTPFGVRIVAFDASRGMTINGKPTKLRGGCIHHDHGLLGAAAYDAAEDRKVRLLRARGYNAVRPSHNLFSPAFLDACDRHGMLVIEETFDTWRWDKLPQDYSVYFDEQWRSDLASIIRSTRNHPSVVMYSVGNEIPSRNSPEGVKLQWDIVNEAHRLDPTRPITAAINSFPGRTVTPTPASTRTHSTAPDYESNVFLDIVGYNYKLADYETDHKKAPGRLFFGTESFPRDMQRIWDLTEREPWLLGDFVWTAMDYLGEAGIGGSVIVPASAKNTVSAFAGWPWLSAYCGDIDLIGQQKGQSLARDVIWGLAPVEVAVQRPVPDGKMEVPRIWGWSDEWPSWTWPGHEGKLLAVRVYTAGDRVQLRLNGKLIEDKAVMPSDGKLVSFNVAYASGILEATALKAGRMIGRRQLTTSGAAASVRLSIDGGSARGGRGDVTYILAEIQDGAGRHVPDATNKLDLTIDGPADLIGFGNASPFATGSFQQSQADCWNGRALAILRGRNQSGTVRVKARTEGLAAGSISVQLS